MQEPAEDFISPNPPCQSCRWYRPLREQGANGSPPTRGVCFLEPPSMTVSAIVGTVVEGVGQALNKMVVDTVKAYKIEIGQNTSWSLPIVMADWGCQHHVQAPVRGRGPKGTVVPS